MDGGMPRFRGSSGKPHGDEVAEGKQPCNGYPGSMLEPHDRLHSSDPPKRCVILLRCISIDAHMVQSILQARVHGADHPHRYEAAAFYQGPTDSLVRGTPCLRMASVERAN